MGHMLKKVEKHRVREFTFNQGCGSVSAKILPLPLPHGLFDLKSNLAKTFCPFPDAEFVAYYKSERMCDISIAREQEQLQLASNFNIDCR